nr:hypothetical protein HmN_000845300 [Hymenolepis microstoma]
MEYFNVLPCEILEQIIAYLSDVDFANLCFALENSVKFTKRCAVTGKLQELLHKIEWIDDYLRILIPRNLEEAPFSRLFKAIQMYAVGLLLLGIVSVSVKWMVRSENGGLLNVIFQIKSPNTTQFQLAPTVDLAFFKNLMLFKPQSLPLLEAIPEEMGGGQKGVNHSHENPNLEAITLWLTICTFSLLNILILIVLMRTCCRRHQVNEEEVEEEEVKEEEVDSEKVSRQRNQTSRKILIGAAVFLIPGLLCLLFFYFSSMSLVIEALDTSSHNQTIGSDSTSIVLFDALKIAHRHTDSFLQKSVKSGDEFILKDVPKFLNSINQRSKELAVEESLYSFNLPSLRQLIQTTVDSSDNIINEMKWNSMENLYREMMQGFHTLHNSIEKASKKLINCVNKFDCHTLKSELTNLKLDSNNYFKELNKFKQRRRNLKEVQQNITEFFGNAQRFISKIEFLLNKTVTSIPDQTSESQITSGFHRQWKNFSIHANTTLQFAKTFLIDSIQSEFNNYVVPSKAIVYSIGSLLVLMLLVFIGLLVNSLIQASRLHYQSEKGLYSGTGKRGYCVVYSLSVLFLLMSVAVSIVVGMSLFGLSVLLGEGCPYIMKETAYKKTDHILNGLGEDYWDALLMKYSDKWLNKSIVPPPKNIIRALSKVCRTDEGDIEKSLLFALGYLNTSIDFKTVLDNPEANQMIAGLWNFSDASRQISTYSIVSKLNNSIASYKSPGEMEELSNMNLRKGSFSISNTLLNQLTHQISKNESDSFSSTIQYLNTTAADIDHKISQIKQNMKETSQGFDNAFHDITKFLSLITNSEKLDNKFEEISDRLVLRIKPWLTHQAQLYFGELTKKVIPCGEAHKAFNVATEATCGDTGLLYRVTAYVYILGINFFCHALFILIFLLLNSHKIMRR